MISKTMKNAFGVSKTSMSLTTFGWPICSEQSYVGGDLNLCQQPFQLVAVQILLAHHLDGDCFVGLFVHCSDHLAEGSSALKLLYSPMISCRL